MRLLTFAGVTLVLLGLAWVFAHAPSAPSTTEPPPITVQLFLPAPTTATARRPFGRPCAQTSPAPARKTHCCRNPTSRGSQKSRSPGPQSRSHQAPAVPRADELAVAASAVQEPAEPAQATCRMRRPRLRKPPEPRTASQAAAPPAARPKTPATDSTPPTCAIRRHAIRHWPGGSANRGESSFGSGWIRPAIRQPSSCSESPALPVSTPPLDRPWLAGASSLPGAAASRSKAGFRCPSSSNWRIEMPHDTNVWPRQPVGSGRRNQPRCGGVAAACRWAAGISSCAESAPAGPAEQGGRGRCLLARLPGWRTD